MATHETRLLEEILEELRLIYRQLRSHPQPAFPTSISFKETSMPLPVEAGNTLVYTGTLSPANATYPTDTVFTVTSNDSSVSASVDSTGLIVTVPLPAGWVESTTTPLAIAYSATSASLNGSLSAIITPGAEVSFPTGITFTQTT